MIRCPLTDIMGRRMLSEIQATGIPTASNQWLIIQGRFDGNDLAPLAAVVVAVRLAVEQHPHPDGCFNRL